MPTDRRTGEVSAMYKILVVADRSEQMGELSVEMEKGGFIPRLVSDGDMSADLIAKEAPNLVLVGLNSSTNGLQRMVLSGVKQERNVPVIALVADDVLADLDPAIDDFVVTPCDSAELVTRIRRILWRTNNIDSEDLIKCGDLVINMAKCEVTLNGRLIDLAFREYELLRFLATNRERVFTREALLNKVWGYDYFGGERTVDVHVRRLRSKIEDKDHSFIDTVRNIGYRFRAGA
ncbi:winged helix-turn-helix domain-containing protein [Chloroflexota bacterium]